MADVKIERLHKAFGDKVIVDELDLVVQEGEFLTLLGPSGCGKTTTLRCVAGLERPDAGSVSIGADLVASGRVHVPPESRGVRMVFQSYALWPHLSVGANVAYPLKAQRIRRPQIIERVGAMLDRVGLSGYQDRSIGSLSGGQQQRVALARALVSEPRVLLFDEPLSNLDARLRTVMRDEIAQLHAAMGSTAIYVTHDQVEALTLSDRIAVMNHGKVHQIGTPREIFGHPVDGFVAEFVGYDNVLTGTLVGAGPDGDAVRLDGSDVTVCCARSRGADLSPGQPAVAAIRAADVRIGASAGPNSLPARVLTSGYVGDHTEYRLDWQGRDLLMSLSVDAQTQRIAVGDEVHVHLPQPHLLSAGAA